MSVEEMVEFCIAQGNKLVYRRPGYPWRFRLLQPLLWLTSPQDTWSGRHLPVDLLAPQ